MKVRFTSRRKLSNSSVLFAAVAGVGLSSLLPARIALGDMIITYSATSSPGMFTVPTAGSYSVTVYGAQGGSPFGGGAGGKGAEAMGGITLSANDLVQVNVGGAGSSLFTGGGGGGSFVYDDTDATLLAAAGGGGGAGDGETNSAGGPGQAGTGGAAGSGAGAGAGGTNGNGGGASSVSSPLAGAGGGGGFLSAGGSSSSIADSSGGGGAFPGLAGGTNNFQGAAGGYGGGGAGSEDGGGGGGGFSGGGGGSESASDGGGGGGSYLSPSFTSPSFQSGVNSGNGSVVIDDTNAGNIVYFGAAAQAISGNISGAGSVNELGATTLTLTGSNSYTGGTNVDSGAIQIGAGGTSGSITGNVSDSSILAFDRSDNVTYSGNISGGGAVVQLGSGTLTLTGANNYTGGTTISAGTLQIGNGGTLGSIFNNVSDNGNLVFDFSSDFTYSGVISGNGSLSQIGTGLLLLGSNNTYKGSTTISNGGVIVDEVTNALPTSTNLTTNGGYLGLNAGVTQTVASVNGSGGGIGISPDGIIIVNQSINTVYGGNIYDGNAFGEPTDTGKLIKQGVGTLALTGVNNFGGGTTISGGSLQVGNGGTAGSIQGNINDNANLAFNLSSNLAFAGNISGSGSLSQLGSGTVALTSNNTYTGGTTISGGTLQVGAGGSSGYIEGNVSDNANFAFDLTNNIAFPGVISGTGNLADLGTDEVILLNTNTYGGSTTINAGVIIATVNNALPATTKLTTSGGYLGFFSGVTQTVAAINGNTGGIGLSPNGILVVNLPSGNDVYSGQIYDGNLSGPSTDTGQLIKQGAGTLTLSGVNDYGGGTTVSAGTLIADAPNSIPHNKSLSIAAAAEVLLASYAGPFTLSSLSITSGGVLDVTTNRLVINYGSASSDPVASIKAALVSGAAFNGTQATWTGSGITSSTAASSISDPNAFAGKTYVVGYLDGNNATDALYGTVAANQILIKYTIAGDAFLENSVGFHDLLIVAQDYQQTGKDYAQGNFFYNPTGSVGFADLLAVAQSYGDSFFGSGSIDGGGNTLPLAWQAAGDNSLTTAAVPDPASLALLAATAGGMLARRRRRLALSGRKGYQIQMD